MARMDDTVSFRETPAALASFLTDGLNLAMATPTRRALQDANDDDDDETTNQPANAADAVIMPWMGFGTYRLGKEQAQAAVLQALRCGYRSIDTAFIYGGETTEKLVGQAIQQAMDGEQGFIRSRAELFITTKHWRKYHGYEPTLKCISLSLKRLQLEYVDLWLMHWPGPAWNTMNRRKELVAEDPWYYSVTDSADMVAKRAETWRGMEEAANRGLCRAIGVSNFTVEHLRMLKKSAVIWPPAINQVEFQYVLV